MKLELENEDVVSPNISGFTHLHVHTVYSTLDGACKLPELMEKAKELGMTAIAETEHGQCGGSLAFQRAAKKAGLKPILGEEAYFTRDMNLLSKPPTWRDAYAVMKMFQNEEPEAIDFNIERLKADRKTADDYYKILTKGDIDIQDLTPDMVIDRFGKTRVMAFRKANKKLLKKYECDTRQYHLILLAMNQTGWQNLITIQSISSRDCSFNGRFLCDLDLLKKYNEGLICTCACVGSLFSKLVQHKKLDEAEQWILKFREVFGDRFYLEIQPLTIPQQIVTNAFYLQMHKKYAIPVVATSDVHYINEEDWDDHDTFLCIAMGKLKSDEEEKKLYIKTHKTDPTGKGFRPRMRYTNDFWLRSKEEMIQAFQNQVDSSYTYYRHEENPYTTEDYRNFWVEAMETTNKVADRVDDDILIGSPVTLYPNVSNVPKGFSHEEWLYGEAMEGLVKYAKKMREAGTPIDFDKYRDRLLDEMAVITTKQYTDYFLGVQEYANWADSINPETGMPNCVVGPGRGSAGASLVLFLIGVTKNIDPIKYDLMFSRFLTMDRNSPPDIDLDFSWKHRPLVIKHLEDVYGKDHVCHIGTWTEESIYTAIKDFGRVLGYFPSETDKINKELQKLVNDAPGASFKMFDALEESEPQSYEQFKEIEKQYPEIFRLARKFEGAIRQFGTHASGVIACPKSLLGLIPTRVDPRSGDTVAMFTGVELESIGIIKFDVLGLKTLDIVEDTLNTIGKDFSWLYDTVSPNDKKAFKMICAGQTDGVFQIESNMMKGLVKNIQPESLEDLSALVAIGRPGPLSAGTDKNFSAWKKHPEERVEYLPGIDDILARSYGTIVYQEQLMQISIRCFGFNQSQSDSITRKILGKKRIEQLPMLRRIMIWGMKSGKGPEGWKENEDSVWYDEDGHYGDSIPGGLALGLQKEQIEKFFNDIQGFASYCFNLGHSLAYGYIALLCAYLKSHYTSQFMAALLSMQDTDDKKEHYMSVCENMGIKIAPPDINQSKASFTALDDHTIAYGLASIKGIKQIDEIIEKAPYTSLQDAFTRLSTKTFKKNVAENLIKAGAFDFENTNRNELLNELYELRKKKEEPITEPYTRELCMEYENKTLGAAITYKPAWKGAMPGEPLAGNCTLGKIRTHITKKTNKEMGMLEVTNETYTIGAIIFPRQYPKLKLMLKEYTDDTKKEKAVYYIKGKMDDKGERLIVDSISPRRAKDEAIVQTNMVPSFDIDPSIFEAPLLV